MFPPIHHTAFKKTLPQWLPVVLLALCWVAGGRFLSAPDADAADVLRNVSGNAEVLIHQLEPDPRGGRAYQLVYIVPVPIDVFWRFKTDFDNDFLLNNKYIREHRFVFRSGDTVITENKYTDGPDVSFKWQTTVFEQTYRLEFVLLNPKECGQRFHYGHITLSPTAQGTQVTQAAYFDFWGVSLWANYPWRGGMRDFLLYTARWEQDTIVRLKNRYTDDPGE